MQNAKTGFGDIKILLFDKFFACTFSISYDNLTLGSKFSKGAKIMSRVVARYEGEGNINKAMSIITDNGFKIKEFIGNVREPEHSHFELIADDKGAYISGHDKFGNKFAIILKGEDRTFPWDTQVSDARGL